MQLFLNPIENSYILFVSYDGSYDRCLKTKAVQNNVITITVKNKTGKLRKKDIYCTSLKNQDTETKKSKDKFI